MVGSTTITPSRALAARLKKQVGPSTATITPIPSGSRPASSKPQPNIAAQFGAPASMTITPISGASPRGPPPLWRAPGSKGTPPASSSSSAAASPSAAASAQLPTQPLKKKILRPTHNQIVSCSIHCPGVREPFPSLSCVSCHAMFHPSCMGLLDGMNYESALYDFYCASCCPPTEKENSNPFSSLPASLTLTSTSAAAGAGGAGSPRGGAAGGGGGGRAQNKAPNRRPSTDRSHPGFNQGQAKKAFPGGGNKGGKGGKERKRKGKKQ